MRFLGFLLLSTFLLEACQAVNPSTGCGRDLPQQPHPGHHHRFRIQFHDKHLGVILRDYILQLPKGKLEYDQDLRSSLNTLKFL